MNQNNLQLEKYNIFSYIPIFHSSIIPLFRHVTRNLQLVTLRFSIVPFSITYYLINLLPDKLVNPITQVTQRTQITQVTPLLK